MRHQSHFPKPGRRARRVRRVYLDLDDGIGHLPLLPFSLVFSQVDTFLPFLLVFQGFLPLLSPSSHTRCVSRGHGNIRYVKGSKLRFRHLRTSLWDASLSLYWPGQNASPACWHCCSSQSVSRCCLAC